MSDILSIRGGAPKSFGKLRDGEKISAEQEKAAREVAAILRKPGAVIIAPTETVYGLMCRWDDEKAKERIYRMKARGDHKPMQMLAASTESAGDHGAIFSPTAAEIAEKFQPGPITIVVPGQSGETIGVRIPDHPFMTALLAELDAPLAATSANRSGQPAALNAQDAAKGLTEIPDLLIDGGEIPSDGQASTVVKIIGGEIEILRIGPIAETDIRGEHHALENNGGSAIVAS